MDIATQPKPQERRVFQVKHKRVIKLKNWWLHVSHVYGQDIINNNKYTRSARSKDLEGKNLSALDFRHGDTIDTPAVTYILIGSRRRKFSDDVVAS